MKRLLITACVLVVVFLSSPEAGFAQNKGFVIQGNLTGIKEGTKISLLTAAERKEAYLRVNDIADTTVSEIIVKNGEFKFEGFILNPAKVYKIAIEGQDKNLILVMLNETVNITGDLFDWPRVDVKNCTYFQERREVERELALIKNKLPISAISGAAELYEAYRKFIAGFASKRLTSKYVPYLLLLHDFTTDEKQAFYDKFSSVVKNSYYGLKLKAQIEFLEGLDKIKENAIIPDFNLITSEGSKFSILDLAKKADYTLLYFWYKDGSMAWEPDLGTYKKLSEKLKQRGINVININIDRKEEDWKPGMQEFDAPGIHARFEMDRSDKILFDLQYTPSQILIDKQGRLISFQMMGSRAASFGIPLGARQLEQTTAQLNKTLKN